MFIFGNVFADMSPTQSGEICTIQWTMRRVEFNQGDGFDNPGFFFFKTEVSALHLQLLLQLFNLNTVKDFYPPTNWTDATHNIFF